MPSLNNKIKQWNNSLKESIKRHNEKEGYDLKILVIIIVFGFIQRLNFLINAPRDFWHDEAFQWIFSQKSIAFILGGNDVHPPLFNLIAKIFLWFSTDIIFLRYMMVFISLYFLYYAFRMMLKVFDKKTAYYGTAMLAIAPTFIYYATEFRVYSWALTIIVCQILAFNVMLKDHSFKNRAVYILLSLVAMYSHYLTGLIVFCQVIYLFFFPTTVSKDMWSMIREYWLKVYLPMFLGLLPLFYYLSLMLPKMTTFWFKNIGFHSLISTFAYIICPPLSKATGIVFFPIIGFVIGIIYFRKLLKAEHIQFLFYLVIPPFTMLIISMTSINFYHHRYFLFGGLSFFVILGWLIARWDDIEPEIGWCAVGVFYILSFFAMNALAAENNTELMSGARFVEKLHIPQGQCYLFHDSTFSQSPFKVYLPNCTHYLVSKFTEAQLFTAGGSAVSDAERCPNFDCVSAIKNHAKLLYVSDELLNKTLYAKGGLYISEVQD